MSTGRLNTRILIAGTLLAAAAPCSMAQAQSLDATVCAALTTVIPASAIAVASGDAVIDSTAFIAPGLLAIAEKGATPASRITPATPAFCKILGHVNPVDPAAPPIRFEVNLPAQWNGRSVQFGGGGFNGTVVTGLGLVPAGRFDQPSPLAQGFVTSGTDSGHAAPPDVPVQAFASNDEALVNFAHAAYKKLHDVSMVLMQRAYGKPPARMYYMGSSEGGREALTMAQRYPNDFDGILARVPVISWTGLIHASMRAGLISQGDAWLRPAQVKLVGDAVLAACDADDGVADGLVANAPACRTKFDPAKLLCTAGQTGDTCLSQVQVDAVNAYHSPLRFPFALANGVTEYPGWGVSGEALAAFGPTGGWGAWFTGGSAPTQPAQPSNGIAWYFGSGAIRHFFVRDPGFDVSRYKPEDYAARVKQVSALMDSTNPDLSAFAAHGGKLIMLEHMSDYAQSPYAGIGYFESVEAKMGKDKTSGFIRLFTAPGVDHVGSGAPANVDMLSALTDWAERDKAPAGLTVLEQKVEAAFATSRALPLCEWPLWPQYKGGDKALAESFACGK